MYFIRYTLLFLLSTSCFTAAAQIYGRVVDEHNEPLPYASVIIAETSVGVSCNTEGKYVLDIRKGRYKLNFQYVGYKTTSKEITFDGTKLEVNIQLAPQNMEIGEVTIKSNAEDPAYAVIRKAIEKRPYYLGQVKSYSCDAYVKGLQRVRNVPKKIFGREIGTIGGLLDSTGKGIIYLSESLSKYYYKFPTQKKEVMVSSKVSGSDNGFSFNRATPLLEYTFYENYIDFNRQILSPIADGALNYYKYKLIGYYYDENGLAVNKIEVIPIRKEDPVFRGFIYIVDNSWNIHSTELYLTAAATKTEVLDTFWIRQVHQLIAPDKIWTIFSQTFDINFNILGIGIKANFSGTFTNYDFHPTFKEVSFDNEIFKVEQNALGKDSLFWKTVRPVPLTMEEQNDYAKKDSLKIIWNSKNYQDSLDKVNNKFKITDLLLGYTYSNSFKNWSIGTLSPVNTIQFNTVQGFNIVQGLYFQKKYDENNLRWWKIASDLNYGFSDRKLRLKSTFTKKFNSINFAQLEVQGGYKHATQFNENNPTTLMLNSYFSLVEKLNLIKLYERDFIGIQYAQELSNGLYATAKAEYAKRYPLLNTSSFTYNKNDILYSSNDPQDRNNYAESFVKNHSLISTLNITYRFRQKFSTFPNRKVARPSRYPYFSVNYLKGWDIHPQASVFDHVNITITQDNFSLGLFGYGGGSIKAGGFLFNKNQQFIDYAHFNGNTLIPILSSFMRLNDYSTSTNKTYVEAHYVHHLQGYIMDKIPLINRLRWKEVIGFSNLWADKQNYSEISLGFENVGYGLFRFIKMHIVWTFKNTNFNGIGLAFQFSPS